MNVFYITSAQRQPPFISANHIVTNASDFPICGCKVTMFLLNNKELLKVLLPLHTILKNKTNARH